MKMKRNRGHNFDFGQEMDKVDFSSAEKEKSLPGKYPKGFKKIRAPRAPIVEPSQNPATREIKTPQQSDIFTKTTSNTVFSICDEVVILIRPQRTELLLNGQKTVITRTIRTNQTDPLKQVKEYVQQVTEPGFRITVYSFASRGRNRIKIEIRSGRENGRHSWKRAHVCDTQKQAIEYIRKAKNRTEQNGKDKGKVRTGKA